MRVEDLVIGKEYYIDSLMEEKGIFRGFDELKNPFFEPTNKTTYYVETDDKNGFPGCVGFLSANFNSPVEP